MLGGGDDFEALLPEALLELGDDGDLVLAVDAPVGPKEEQDGVAEVFGEGLGLAIGEAGGGFESGRRFPFERQEVQVLLDAGSDGGGFPAGDFVAEEADGLVAASGGCGGLALDFDGGSEGGDKGGRGVEIAFSETGERQLADFCGGFFGFPVVFGPEFAARDPGEAFEVFGCIASCFLIELEGLAGLRKISGHGRNADLINDHRLR